LGKPSKHGNYKKRFKASVFYVNLNEVESLNYSSNSPFYLNSEKFGRVKGFCEGKCSIKVENSEELINFLLRYVAKMKPSVIKTQISGLIGNAVNKVLEKSKLNFADVLLRPQLLEQLNDEVSKLVSEYGIYVKTLSLYALKLSGKMQKKVNEFLSNRANFNYNEGIEIKSDLTITPQVEESEPQPVMQIKEEKTESVAVEQPQKPVPNSLLNRRMASGGVIETGQNGKITLPNFNANDILNNSNNLKQCKFCNATIEMHHKYCPKCGFKQY
jgi:hypothetical protein